MSFWVSHGKDVHGHFYQVEGGRICEKFYYSREDTIAVYLLSTQKEAAIKALDRVYELNAGKTKKRQGIVVLV
jgi:hypothetical protein